jgi:hypothetical protein
MIKPLAAAAIALGLSSMAQASSCNQEIKIPIRFERGAVCWRFVGVATTFVGDFAKGQHISAMGIGETYTDTVAPVRLQISLSGPNNAFIEDHVESESDPNDFGVLPRSGRYEFQIGPCAQWGSEVMIKICAANR